MINLWKYSSLHIVHVIRNVDLTKLANQWCSSEDSMSSLKEMIMDYLPHLKLHLGEIEDLMDR